MKTQSSQISAGIRDNILFILLLCFITGVLLGCSNPSEPVSKPICKEKKIDPVIILPDCMVH